MSPRALPLGSKPPCTKRDKGSLAVGGRRARGILTLLAAVLALVLSPRLCRAITFPCIAPLLGAPPLPPLQLDSQIDLLRLPPHASRPLPTPPPSSPDVSLQARLSPRRPRASLHRHAAGHRTRAKEHRIREVEGAWGGSPSGAGTWRAGRRGRAVRAESTRARRSVYSRPSASSGSPRGVPPLPPSMPPPAPPTPDPQKLPPPQAASDSVIRCYSSRHVPSALPPFPTLC